MAQAALLWSLSSGAAAGQSPAQPVAAQPTAAPVPLSPAALEAERKLRSIKTGDVDFDGPRNRRHSWRSAFRRIPSSVPQRRESSPPPSATECQCGGNLQTGMAMEHSPLPNVRGESSQPLHLPDQSRHADSVAHAILLGHDEGSG